MATIEERFWPKVAKGDGCWEWTACRLPTGYGNFRRRDGGTWRAHRVAWELTYGPIPVGLHVLHRCDNPPCVRPDHLWLGDDAANARDMAEKGRTGRARLTVAQVLAIRAEHRPAKNGGAPGANGAIRLARKYGVSHRNIEMILARKTWAWLP